MTRTGKPLTRSIVTMSITLIITTAVLFNACSPTATSSSSPALSMSPAGLPTHSTTVG